MTNKHEDTLNLLHNQDNAKQDRYHFRPIQLSKINTLDKASGINKNQILLGTV